MKFKTGDIICRPNKENYSHASIYSGSFVVSSIKDNRYILQQANFYGDMEISCADSIFIIDKNPKGYIVNIRDHIIKNII